MGRENERERDPRRVRAASPARRRWAGVLALSAVVVVTALGVLVSFQLGRQAELRHRLALSASNLNTEINRLALSASVGRLQGWSSALAAESSEIKDEIRADVALLRGNGLDGMIAPALAEAESYLVLFDQQVALLRAGDVAGARALAAEHSVGTFNELDHTIDHATAELEVEASRASSISRAGTVATLLIVVLLVASSLWWQSRLRRRQAVVAAESESRARFEAIIEHSTDLVLLSSPEGAVEYLSPSAGSFFGMTIDQLAVTPPVEVVHPDDLPVLADAFRAVRRTGNAGPFDIRMRHHDGSWRTLEVIANDLTALPTVAGIVWNTREVTDRKRLEAELTRQAFEDSLTGLANRALFRDRLVHALDRAARSGANLAVLLVDLDGFKTINDGMGHDAGDDALVEIASRIAASVRPSDTVARLGGDEFVVLLEDVGDDIDAVGVADRILNAVREPVLVQGVELRITASLGVVESHGEDHGPDDLVRNADAAMYAAKARGRDAWVRFEPAMHARAADRLVLSQDLARALERQQLELYFQPSVALDRDATIEGVEALLRWKHPERGLIGPGTFIPLAEQNGLIVPIGRWTLAAACKQAVNLNTRFPRTPRLSMSVNVSARQLAHTGLVPDVRAILAETGLDPASLVLEITETTLMADVEVAIARLRELKDLGLRLAIDDFGTGYSSLAYLRQFPVDILKIDRMFVEAASAGDTEGETLVRAVVDLAANLGLETIVEGVELPAQAEQMRHLGCGAAQGFLYARPMPADQLIEFLNSRSNRTQQPHSAPMPTPR